MALLENGVDIGLCPQSPLPPIQAGKTQAVDVHEGFEKADGVTPVAPALRMVLRVFDLRTVWLDENLSLAVLQPERR